MQSGSVQPRQTGAVTGRNRTEAAMQSGSVQPRQTGAVTGRNRTEFAGGAY